MSTLYNRLLEGRDYKVSGKEIIIDCPECFGSFKMYLNFEKGVFHCFRCGKSGRIKQILPDLKREDIVTKPEFKVKIELPTDCIPVTKSSLAMWYLNKRDIKPLEDWKFCLSGLYEDRIIIPVTFNDEFQGFQARTIHVPTKEGDTTVCWCGQQHYDLKRYLTSAGMKISQILYNYDVVNSEECFVVEGIFNTIRLRNSVAAFSKTLSSRHIELLAVKYPKVTLALDRDAQQETVRTGYLLSAFGVQVFVLPLIKKDPAEHTVEQLKELKEISFFSWISSYN